MLKRNGEQCQYQVPGFAGRLTKTEHAAYIEAVASVEAQLKQFNEAAIALAGLENELPGWTELPPRGSGEKAQLITVQGNEGAPWQVLRTLSKAARNEVLFCVRAGEAGKEFGIVEKFDPHSAYARAQGVFEPLMTSNNARLLMQDFLESERAILQMFRREIEATIEESLAEKYPCRDLSRVIKAVSRRCNSQTPAQSRNSRAHTISSKVRIRF